MAQLKDSCLWWWFVNDMHMTKSGHGKRHVVQIIDHLIRYTAPGSRWPETPVFKARQPKSPIQVIPAIKC